MTRAETVFIVDDDSSVREGLQMLFESAGYDVVAFADAESFLDYYEPDFPGCLVLDLQMPSVNGLELQEQLAKLGTPPPVIFLTGHGSVPAAVKALKKGAIDFIQKPITDDQLLLDRVAEAIQQDHEKRSEYNKNLEAKKRLDTLTPRETEVMKHICMGKANKVIAIDLGISERTVELHRSRVMQKLGIRTVVELVNFRDSIRDI